MSIWRLHSVTISNLLGYQGAKTFAFSEGLQVIEAPNHTGKTSLTFSLLWALTGEIPRLPRINLKSFRLSNKHAGGDAVQFCQVELIGDDGRRLVIKRTYSGAKSDWEKDLAVDVDDAALTGGQAQQRILQELKLKTGSLEGCGVVLQDQRLGFITGKESDISEVLNDMLGLTVLSQLVPTFEEQLKAAKDLQKEISSFLETADPLARWVQREQEYHAKFQSCENEAIVAGFSRDQMENPAATARQELDAVAKTLDTAKAGPEASLTGTITGLRTRLDTLRKASPLGQELAKLQGRKSLVDQSADAALACRDAYAALNKKLAGEACLGEMDCAAIAATMAGIESTLQANRKQRDCLKEEHGLLTSAYQHLLGHQDMTKCPVCESNTPASDLLKKIKSRLETGVSDLLSSLKQADDALSLQLVEAGKRLKLVQGLKDEHRRQYEQIEAFRTRIKDEPFALAEPLEFDGLFLHEAERTKLLSRLSAALEGLKQMQAGVAAEAMKKQEEAAQQEEKSFQPAEKQIIRVSEKLMPVIAAAEAIESHGKLRDKATGRKTELEKLREEAQATAGSLQKIAKALAAHEEQSASAAVRARLPRMSGFFKAVAANPDYDGLDIQTAVSRGQVAYKIQAISSSIGNLNDAVGHVLSEGDLSAASIALLVGLASGESHHLGFLLLDDPAQGMDEALQANLAATVSKLDNPKQVIILTHQRTFADALKHAGAKHDRMHSWHLGKVTNE